MRTKPLIWGVMACVFAVSIVSSFDWAPADAAHLDQGTVPTRTPTSPPPTATPPRPAATAAPATLIPTPVEGGPPELLPVAGTESSMTFALFGVAGLGLLSAAWAVRRHKTCDTT